MSQLQDCNTNTELIARLRDGQAPRSMAIDVLLEEAADAIEALETKMQTLRYELDAVPAIKAERDSLSHHLNRQKQWKDAMRDKMLALEAQVETVLGQNKAALEYMDAAEAERDAEVEQLKALSVTNIMLDVIPGDGSGFEVYAKSVDDVVNKLTELGGKAEDAQGDNVTLQAQLAAAQTCIQANHQWHLNHDDFDGYEESDLWVLNMSALFNDPIQQQVAEPSVPEGWKQAVALAYGHLWHVNNEPMAPIPLRSSETAAYEARKQLRDLLTHEERGIAINQVQVMLAAAPQPKEPATYTPPKIIDPDAPHPCFN